MNQLTLYKKTIVFTSGVIFAIGLLAIIGWILKIEILTQVIYGLPTMKFNTALCFLLLAVVIYSTGKKNWNKLVLVLNGLLLLISFLTFLQDILNYNLGIDQLFIYDEKGILSGNPKAGRMSMATSMCFVLLSIALFLIQKGTKLGKTISANLAHLVSFFSALATISYLFQVATINKIEFISSMAIHTAICFFLASIAVAMMVPKHGLTKLFSSKKLGNYIIRRLFFQLSGVTFIISYTILYFFRKNYLAPDFALAILGTSIVVIALLMLIIVAHSINKLEKERKQFKTRLQITSTYLNATPDPIVIIDSKGFIQLSNDLMKDFLGYKKEELLGKKITTLIHDEFKEQYLQQINQFTAKQNSGKSYNSKDENAPTITELQVLKKNGDIIPVELTLNAINADNEITILVALRDISRRVLAEENFKAANEKVLTAIDASIVGIWNLDIVNQQLKWDETMFKLYGLPSQSKNISLDHWKNSLHPDDLERVTHILDEALANRGSYDTDFRVIWPDRTIHYIRAKGFVYLNEKNEPVRMLGTNWDITPIKETQLELESSIAQNKLFIDEAPSAIAMFDNNMVYQAASKKWLKDYGINENVIGKSHYEIFPEIGEDWKKIHRECLAGATNTCDEALFERADGTKQWITWKVKPWYKKPNEIGGILMYTANITQFKKNVLERLRLQDLLDQSNEVAKIGTWEFNNEKQTLSWSSLTKRLHEVSDDYIPSFDSAIEFYQKEDAEKLKLAINKTLNTGTSFDLELRFITAKYTKKWVRVIGQTKPSDKGIKVSGIVQDISTIKSYESSLIQAKQKAEAASKSKSEFLANMSHEIRTPLNGIIGFTDLLMKSNLSESQEKYMQTVYSSANHLLDIINDILDFSKIEAGKLELSIEKVDLMKLCSQTMDIIKHQAHAKGLEVLLDVSTKLDGYVYADSVRLRQVLTNLLGNAIKFTEQGEVEMKVRCVPESSNKSCFRFLFSIRDTGVGIASQNLTKIFKAFDQEDASTTRKFGGTGLGLTISNRLLELMGSKLEVESELGKGSTFSFLIDFKTEKRESKSGLNEFKKVNKVLIIDDNQNNRTILIDMLEANNINVVAASNGIEAMEIIETQNNFDLVITDFNMPYLTGIEVVDYIRNTFKLGPETLPIMLLHSSVDDETINKACKNLEIQFNITKPILYNQLYEVIESIERPITVENVEIRSENISLQNIVCNVLIVEDNPVNKLLARTLIQKLLPQSTIIEAENGLEAVNMFKEYPIDIIFMDIQMPVMSGFEATREIRKIEKPDSRIPIIALTARSIKNERERCLKHGMNDYITKPVIYDTIKKVLYNYLFERKTL